MSQKTDNQGILLALSQCIEQSVALVHSACLGKGKVKDSDALRVELDKLYAKHIKARLKDQSLDEGLERELATSFGAFTSSMASLYASWSVYFQTKDRTVNITMLAHDLSVLAVSSGDSLYKSASQSAFRRERAEERLNLKAETFVRRLREHLRSTDRDYEVRCSSREYTVENICFYPQGKGKFIVHFDHHDGVEVVGMPLGELFRSDADKTMLETLATEVFGAPIRFDKDYGTLQVDLRYVADPA